MLLANIPCLLPPRGQTRERKWKRIFHITFFPRNDYCSSDPVAFCLSYGPVTFLIKPSTNRGALLFFWLITPKKHIFFPLEISCRQRHFLCTHPSQKYRSWQPVNLKTMRFLSCGLAHLHLNSISSTFVFCGVIELETGIQLPPFLACLINQFQITRQNICAKLRCM